MSSPIDSQNCPTCGEAIPADSPGGWCPACLLDRLIGEGAPDNPASADTVLHSGALPHGSPPDDLQQIGPYQLVEKIGEGGFGVVYRARQKEPIKRVVALKVIKPGMDSRQIIARFEAERQTLALMEHPNIAGVLDAGTTEAGLPYFVMELVRGQPITEFCDERRLTIRQRLELFIPVCQAVQHAHQKAVLHRDLKPSNILVTEVDGKPVPKVIDFGIAKAIGTSPEAALRGSPLQTQAGAVIGTPQYMSPEQAGATPDLDTRSDVYTLGVILYELLTGHTPLSREKLKHAAFDEMLRLIRESETRRPSSRLFPVSDAAQTHAIARNTEAKKLSTTLRGDLDWIMLKALEKERERRYGSAASLAQDLERHLRNDPVEAGPPDAIYRFRKMVRRNRLAFTAAALIAVVLIAGVGGTSVGLLRERRIAVQLQEEKLTQNQLLWTASHGDHVAALRAVEEHRPAEALAAFRRSMEYRSMNTAALVASAAHAYGINSTKWRSRSVLAFEGGVNGISFTADGKYMAVVTGWYREGGELRVIEASTGLKKSSTKFDDSVTEVSFSPDGRHVAVGGFDKTLRLIETTTGKEVQRTEFGDDVTSVSFSPDGKLLAAGSVDHSARVFEVVTGREIGRTEFGGSVGSVTFSPDGRYLAAGGVDDTARVIDVASGNEVSRTGCGGMITSICFSPDSRHLAVTGGDQRRRLGETRVVEVLTGNSIMKLTYNDLVQIVTFSPDGRCIATGGWDDTARVIDLTTRREISSLTCRDDVRSISFSPDGRCLAVGAADKSTRIIEVSAGQEMGRMEFGGTVTSVRFSPDGRFLAAGSWDNTLRVIEAATGPEIGRTDYGGSIWEVNFSPNGQYLALAGTDGSARIIDTTTGREVLKKDFGAEVSAARFSSDGRYLGVCSWDKTACVFDVTTHDQISATQSANRVNSLAFSPDSRYFAICSGDSIRGGEADMRLVETATGKEAGVIKFDRAVTSLCFTTDGRHVAAGGADGTLRVMDVTTGRETRKSDLGGRVFAMDSSPSEGHVAVGGAEKAVRVIDVATGRLIRQIRPEFGREISAISYSRDGRHLSLGSADETGGAARVLDAATGLEISRTEFGRTVSSLSFSSDGRFLAGGSADKTLRVVDVAMGKEVCRYGFGDGVKMVSLSDDGRYMAACAWDRTVRLYDARWFLKHDDKPGAAWLTALNLQSGVQRQANGDLRPLSIKRLLQSQDIVRSFIATVPIEAESWQHAILKWSQMLPEQRTTSPWTDEPVRFAVGRWLMNAIPITPTIIDCANQAPWHPLTPVSLARLEAKPNPMTDAATREAMMIRPAFLARLTLKRLREADTKLYGADVLAAYAAKAAEWMSGLKLSKEAAEALQLAGNQ